MSESKPIVSQFSDLNLPAGLNKVLDEVGYETPTPIQAKAIPYLLEGRDVLGRAPTGTGKTAAFALPLLARTDLKSSHVQILVLAPTRELAIQVSEAFQQYARHLPGFHVLPIYGGTPYTGQVRQLRRGVQAVVGTPGRVMDHMRKGNLRLGSLKALVLDEADEMLKMGFIDDIEWILDQAPADRQMALFSATMPKQIQRIAEKHLRNPKEVSIQDRATPAETINQRYWVVSHQNKIEALTRILEAEPTDAVLIFVRTKVATAQLAERLEARGYAAVALNGDMAQKNREQVVSRLKKGLIDIVVATDVAARGLDVERISHVINYDIPHGTEGYVHRIGRTGRAGRTGEAILFVTPREKRMLHTIERATRSKIALLQLPTTEMVNNRRIATFMQGISDTVAGGELDFMRGLIEQYSREHNIPALDVAAALAKMSMGDRKLLLEPAGKSKSSADTKRSESNKRDRFRSDERPERSNRSDKKFDRKTKKDARPKEFGKKDFAKKDFASKDHVSKDHASTDYASQDDLEVDNKRRPSAGTRGVMSKPDRGMERFRIHVGSKHEVEPKNIVGAIANEAGLESQYIGPIQIWEDISFVDLPRGMPNEVFRHLAKVWVSGQQLNIERLEQPKKKSKKSTTGRKGDKKTSSRKTGSKNTGPRRGSDKKGGPGKRKE